MDGRRTLGTRLRVKLVLVLGTVLVLLLAACGADDVTDDAAPDEADAPDTAPDDGEEAPDDGEEAADDAPETDAAEPQDLTLATGWIANVQFAGEFLALDRGYYNEHGVNVTINPGGPNAPNPVVVVAGGDADIGMLGDFSAVIEAIDQGNDFVIIGAKYQRSPGGVISLAENPVTTPEELVGTRFCGQEGSPRILEAVLEGANQPVEYDFIPVGFDPEPLVRGDCDVYVAFATNQAITLEQQFDLEPDEDFIFTTWEELGFPFYSDVVFAERSWLEENREAAIGFLAGAVQGWEENLNLPPEEAAEMMVNDYGVEYGLDLEQQTRQNEVQQDFLQSEGVEDHGLFWVDVDYVGGPIFEALSRAGWDVPDDANEIVDPSFLEEAHSRLDG